MEYKLHLLYIQDSKCFIEIHIRDKLKVSEGNVLAFHDLFRPHIQSDPDFSPQGLDLLSRWHLVWWGHAHRSLQCMIDALQYTTD